MLAGALFDWDGVIIDSHEAHERAWEALAAELGRPLPPGFFKRTFGMRNDVIIPQHTGWIAPGEEHRVGPLGDRKEALYREVLQRDGIEPLAGVVALLRSLRDAGLPCAVGSSTSRANIETIMDMTGLGSFFQAIAAEKDVVRGKPAPDVFLAAAEKIGVDPTRCVVFEDAHVGIQAGRAAGAKTVAVATTHAAASFAGTADLVVETLEDVSLATLHGLFAHP